MSLLPTISVTADGLTKWVRQTVQEATTPAGLPHDSSLSTVTGMAWQRASQAVLAPHQCPPYSVQY